MPVDLYVDPVAGSDAASGGVSDPFRSLSRAAARAAELDLAGESGAIHAAAGVYSFPAENFPIIVPASFDLLGAGRDLTEIVFTGETREYLAEDGTSFLYWGGEAIQGGRSIRRLTVRSMPAPYYSCIGMTGIRTTVNGTVVEDVRVHIDPADAAIAEGASYSEVGFGRQLFAIGIEITVLDCLFERGSRKGMLLAGCDGAVLRTISDNADCSTSSDSSLIIDGCFFLNRIDVKLFGNSTLRSSDLDGLLNLYVAYDGNRFGPGNVFRGNFIWILGDSEIYRSDIQVAWGIEADGDARIIENDIRGASRTYRLLQINSGTPVVQGNRFFALPAVDPSIGRNGSRGMVAPIDFTAIEIRASADFGGEISMGRNDFSQMFSDILYTPTRIRIDAPEATVRFDDNFWDDPLSAERRRFEVLSPDTMLSVRNPMRAP